jgi:beta-N-acetylhexosaminidase
MIIVGFSGAGQTGIPALPDSLIKDLNDRNLGGVIFYGYNLVNPSQIKTLTAEINANSKTTPFIATDEEGGMVARLGKNNGFQSTYTAYQLGTIFHSEDSTRMTAAKMAGWLSESGINVDFAPVADVDVNPNSPAIGYYQRSFSKFPDSVADFAEYFIDELHNKNVIPTLKHFPGHGSAMTDSHLGFTDITNTWTDSELIPYKTIFSDGYNDMVMVGHLYNAHLDSLYPASLSKKVTTGILKDSLGFNGVVISDEMTMGAISDNYSFNQAVELAINAGVDILLYKTNLISNGSENVSLCDSVINLVVKDVAAGEIPESRIEDAYNHIMNLKEKYLNVSSVSEPIAKSNVPSDFSITNYPNPFNPTTKIVFNIAKAAHVSLKVYNVTGQIISEIFNHDVNAGKFEVNFNGSKLASGVYFAVLQTPNAFITHKILLLK